MNYSIEQIRPQSNRKSHKPPSIKAAVLAVKHVRPGSPSLPVTYFVLVTLMTLTARKVGSYVRLQR